MSKLWIGLALCVCAAAAIAEDVSSVKAAERKAPPEILDRNVKLEFKAVPAEEDDEGIYVITASSGYKTGIRLEGEEGKMEFTVSGVVKLLDDGRIFVRYFSNTIFVEAETDGQASFNVASSVLLKPGQELGVSKLGDRTLMIRASYVDGAAGED